MTSVNVERIDIMKKLVSLILSVLFLFSFQVNIFAATSSSPQKINLYSGNKCISVSFSNDIIMLENDDDTIYYLQGNSLYRVEHLEKTMPMTIENGLYRNAISVDDFEFFELKLSPEEINAILSDPVTRASYLTKSDQSQDSMGSVRATLSVDYLSKNYNGELIPAYHIHEINAETKQISSQGVIPQTSKLQWSVTGQKFENGTPTVRGVFGESKNYDSPYITYSPMDDDEYIRPDSNPLHIIYSCECTRGISVSVTMDFS